MADLPESRLASSPLFSLAIAISAGIASAHYLDSQSKSALIVSIVIGISCTFFSIALLIRNRTTLSSEFLIGGVFFAGLILVFTDTRPRAVDRISRMYDEGVLTYDEPVELTGIVQGQPEPAPDGFYLTLRAETISFNGS